MKKIILFLTLVIFFLAGCNKVTEVDGKSFVTAIGFDKGENYSLRFTFVFTSPTEGGEKSSDVDDETVVIEAPSLFSAIEQINNFKSKTIELSHTQTVIFSEELAKEGLSEHIYSLVRSSHFRPNIYVCIAENSAMEFLENINPVKTYHLEKYFQLFFDKMSSGKRGDLFLYDTYFRLLTKSGAGVLPYCAINRNQIETNEKNEYPSDPTDITEEPSKAHDLGTFSENTDDFAINTIAGDTIRKSKNSAEILGVSIIKNGKFVSLLGKNEAMVLQMITGSMPNNYITISNPKECDKMIVCHTILKRNKINVNCKEKPEIKVNIELEGDFSEMGKNDYYIKNPSEFELYFEEKVKEMTESFLNKISKELNCDICGFSEVAKGSFLSVDGWNKYDWDKKFPDSVFDVNVNLTIRTYGELSEDAKER